MLQYPRKSRRYHLMTPFEATSIAEGFCGGEDASEEEMQIAWQYIWDSKLYLHLQGWYGRNCYALLADGLIQR